MSPRPPLRGVLIFAAAALTIVSAVAIEATAPDSASITDVAIGQRLAFDARSIAADPAPGPRQHQRRRRPPAGTTPASAPAQTTAAAPAVAPAAYPSAAPVREPNVGLPDGTVLTRRGSLLITQPGTVIDKADIRGPVVVDAANVVIRRSKVSGDGDMGVYVRHGSLLLEDVSVVGFDNSVGGDNYTATRVEVTAAGYDGFKIGDNVTIQDSWCHDMTIAGDAHADCGQVQSGVVNVMIRRNWFDITDRGNSALFIAPDLGENSPGPLVVEYNVLGGGNFTLQCVDGDYGRYLIGNIAIRRNQFISNSNYGPMRVNVPTSILGNIYRGTLLPVLP